MSRDVAGHRPALQKTSTRATKSASNFSGCGIWGSWNSWASAGTECNLAGQTRGYNSTSRGIFLSELTRRTEKPRTFPSSSTFSIT